MVVAGNCIRNTTAVVADAVAAAITPIGVELLRYICIRQSINSSRSDLQHILATQRLQIAQAAFLLQGRRQKDMQLSL